MSVSYTHLDVYKRQEYMGTSSGMEDHGVFRKEKVVLCTGDDIGISLFQCFVEIIPAARTGPVFPQERLFEGGVGGEHAVLGQMCAVRPVKELRFGVIQQGKYRRAPLSEMCIRDRTADS